MDTVSQEDARKPLDGSKVVASQEAYIGLRRVPDKFPRVALLILIVEVSYPFI